MKSIQGEFTFKNQDSTKLPDLVTILRLSEIEVISRSLKFLQSSREISSLGNTILLNLHEFP